MIEYQANGGTASGYLARPEGGTGVGKGVIVIQEWWGLVPHIKDIANRFSRLGYAALAPDLWDGKQTTGRPDESGRMLMALDIENAAKKIAGAVEALRAHGGVTGKVGVVGFCMGGKLALYAATKLNQDVGACVDFYGVHPNVKPDFASLKCPVLGIFGEKDASVPPAAARELESTIKAAGGKIDVQIYPADHAFFNDTRPEVYDAASADDAWHRTTAFFAANL
jgi:carboxymethylenebutenolidase